MHRGPQGPGMTLGHLRNVMTRKEFECLRGEIQREKLVITGDYTPLAYALKRAEFKRAQLARLIEIGRKVRDSKTVQRKIAAWERQIRKTEALPERFTRLFSGPPRVTGRVS